MVKTFQTKFFLYALISTVMAFSPLCQVRAEDKIIAVVNNEIITQKDLDDFMNFMNLQLSAKYKGKELKEKVEAMKPDLLSKLIEDRLILQQARKEKVAIEAARIDARIDEIKSRYPSEARFQNALSDQGLTLADIRLKIEEQSLIYEIIELKVRNKIIVNPREVTEFYNQHAEEFVSPEGRDVTALIIKDKDQLDKVKDLVKQGMDFEEINAVYEIEVNKLGLVRRGQLMKEIEEAIFNLGVGSVSEPVRINGQYYIFIINQIVPSGRYTLSEVQDAIYNRIYELRMQEKLEQWLKELKRESYVEIK